MKIKYFRIIIIFYKWSDCTQHTAYMLYSYYEFIYLLERGRERESRSTSIRCEKWRWASFFSILSF